MKLNNRNLPTLLGLCFLSALGATLLWDIFERLLALGGLDISLSVGPIGFDLSILALWIRVNPGSAIGIVPGVLLFRNL